MTLLAPSGPVDAGDLERGLAALAELGIAHGGAPPGVLVSDAAGGPYLAGEDAARAGRLVRALESGADALWMIRGGYGGIRTLEAAGPGLFDRAPAALWGFSDGTALLAAWDRAGWPAWHAAPVTQLPRLDAASRARMDNAVGGAPPEAFEGLAPLAEGRATAPLAGGNLCVLASLVGTPFEARLAGRIVVLEDVGERPYRVDRLFTQLRLSRGFAGASGLVLGDFTGVGPEDAATIEAFFRTEARRLGIPVAAGLPIGHGERNAPLPFGAGSGAAATLTVDRHGATLGFEEVEIA